MSLELEKEKMYKLILKLFKSTIKNISVFNGCNDEELERIIINVVFELMEKKGIIKTK